MALTERSIRALKPKARPYRTFDGNRSGLLIQTYPSGARTWFVAYSDPDSGKRRFHRLQAYPDMSLAKAREAAERVRRETINKGLDPKREAQRQAKREQHRRALEDKRKAERNALGSVRALFESYVARLKAEGKPSHAEAWRSYEKDIEPVLGRETKAKDVGPDDVVAVLRPIIKRDAMVHAERVRGLLHAAYQFGARQDHDPLNLADQRYRIRTNPVDLVARVVHKPAVGERNLSRDELRSLWSATVRYPLTLPMKAVIKLLIATGQRVQEVSGARWSEFDLERRHWEIPAGRSKNKLTHVVPLGTVAVHVLEHLRRYPAGDFLAPHRDKPGEPIAWRSVSQAMSRALEGKGIEKVTARDLRRTWKTLAGEAGLSKQIRDRLQNHAQDDVSARHYDRYDYLLEKTEAMAAWDGWLWNTLRGRS